MSGWEITVELLPDRVTELLSGMNPEAINQIRTGTAIRFGDGIIAYVYDATPDVGTDIIVKDWTDTVAPRMYEFLCQNSDGYVWMTDDGGHMVAERGSPADGSRPAQP